MDNDEICKAFLRAGKQENALDISGLTVLQLACSKAIYGHLRSLTENFRKAAKIIRLVKGNQGLEAWRSLVRRFDPQSREVHAPQLQHIATTSQPSSINSRGSSVTTRKRQETWASTTLPR